MSDSSRDAPYPELKKTHTMAHVGRPFTDYKPPAAAPVWAVIEGLGRYHVLLAALELGVFEALDGAPDSGTTAGELAGRLGLPELHLESLLDSVVALGLLDRVVDGFKLNDAARRYLLVDGAASMAGLIPVAPGPHENWTRLADTVRSGRPATPIDDDPAAFYVPLVEGTFTTMWRCASRADFKMRYSALAAPRILDLGAGGAPWSIAMLQACGDGRATVNDLDGVISVARRKTAEHSVADRCEFRPGDFHAVPLENGAYDIVVLGHVCRTEGPGGRPPSGGAGLRSPAARGPGSAGRLLRRPQPQDQPPRGADGNDHDGQHRQRLRSHHRRGHRLAARHRLRSPPADRAHRLPIRLPGLQTPRLTRLSGPSDRSVRAPPSTTGRQIIVKAPNRRQSWNGSAPATVDRAST